MNLASFSTQILAVLEDDSLAPAVERGETILSDTPGFGVEFDDRAVERYRA